MGNSIKRYIISGGPGSGKTSLLEALREKGCACFEEVSRQIIREQQEKGGDMLPWKNLPAFAEANRLRMIQDFDSATEGANFYDRGIPDLPAYFRFRRLPVEEVVFQSIENKRYTNMVFMNPPWEDIFVNDAERPETYQDSVKIYEHLKESYTEAGYQIYELPKQTVEERAKLVLSLTG